MRLTVDFNGEGHGVLSCLVAIDRVIHGVLRISELSRRAGLVAADTLRISPGQAHKID
jgi:hypothetical protein